jgi:hypothetical protein
MTQHSFFYVLLISFVGLERLALILRYSNNIACPMEQSYGVHHLFFCDRHLIFASSALRTVLVSFREVLPGT